MFRVRRGAKSKTSFVPSQSPVAMPKSLSLSADSSFMWLPRLCTAMHTLRSCPCIHTQPSHQHCEGAVQYAVPRFANLQTRWQKSDAWDPVLSTTDKAATVPCCCVLSANMTLWSSQARDASTYFRRLFEKWFMWAHPGTLKKKTGFMQPCGVNPCSPFSMVPKWGRGPPFLSEEPWGSTPVGRQAMI